MPTFKETVLSMVARKELTADQAMSLIRNVRDARATAPAPRQPVAIIGMSGRFPGAHDVDTFWQNVRAGINSVAEIPRTRWDVDSLYDPDPRTPGKTYCKWGGFLDGVDEFDAAFFNISAKEAQLTDPQQRLFLQEAYRALEDAGLTAKQLDGVRCGVFAGAGGGDYIHAIAAEGIAADAYAFMGNASSILSARISYLLNLKGPSLAVDTACSSSLVAIHLACESLALGTSDLALAGGVCVLNTPNFYLAGSKAGMLSRSGACRTFDSGADGFVPAEGVGVIVLKPLARAIADGDRIHAVIEGSAINQDGRTNGITAPSAPSQTALELEVYEKFGIAPATIGYVEAHGTGTALGDPIEVEAITAAFRRHTDATGFCTIGSSKANIGHAMSASGMAGVIKVVKAIEAAEIPPSIQFEKENKAIGFASTPFRVATSLEAWPQRDGVPRRAAVSSFGFSGTNVHLVIAEAPQQEAAAVRGGQLPFVISAKSRRTLDANCAALADWLEHHPEARLDSVSSTLLTGRNHHEHRVIVFAESREQLIAQLRGPLHVTTAEVPDASVVFGETLPPKISLPTYRFEPRRHRLGKATKPKMTSAPHPLLDGREGNVFSSRWDAAMPFLRDHRVGGRHILPGACLVEMALAATGAKALDDVLFRVPLELANGSAGVELILDADGAFVFRSGERDIATGRAAAGTDDPAQPAVDIDEWMSIDPVDTEALFRGFEAAGVILGPYCRGLNRLWIRGEEAFAELQLPAGESRSLAHYTFHPTLLDGAFQAAMALVSKRAPGVLVPASIGSIRIDAPLPALCYARVQLTSPLSFDVTFVDENGRVLATVQRFEVRELGSARPLAAPRSSVEREIITFSPAKAGEKVAEGRMRGPSAAEPHLPNHQPPSTELPRNATHESIPFSPAKAGEKVAEGRMTGPSAAEPSLRYYQPQWIEIERPEPAEPREGVTLIVRAADATFDGEVRSPSLEVILGDSTIPIGPGQLQLDVDDRAAFESLITDLKPLAAVMFIGGANAEGDVVALLHLIQSLPKRRGSEADLRVVVAAPPENGAVIGFAQTVSREQTHLRFTILETDTPSTQLLNEQGQEPGVVFADRNGTRFRRQLAPHRVSVSRTPIIKRGGVYVIAGGGGGIGVEVARHLATTYDARVILLGRRERQMELGRSVTYRRVDITDAAAVRSVAESIRTQYGTVNGVINAAMVLRDGLVEKMESAALRSVLAPKLSGSRILAEVFGSDPLDFFAFFSSANSFFGNAGQANYAAASMAQDAFARQLASRVSYPVRIINWGFWGEVGAVATPLHRKRASEHGIGAIGVAEGLGAFEAALSGDELQLMPMKVEPQTLSRMGLLSNVGDDESAIARAFANVENYGRAQLARYIDAHGRLTLDTARKYERLRAALEAIATKPIEPHQKPADDWTAPFARLIDRCLHHYPEVLAGKKNAAEVLFPGGSTEWVAPLYRENPIVDRYNDIVAEQIRARVEQLLDRQNRVRIVELGGGTGGTSRAVLAALAARRTNGSADLRTSVEYVFTDLSNGLVRQTKNELAEQYPFARFAVFDMEKDPRSQGFDENAFDVVFASNAIHATRNIAVSLGNARKLLRDGGLLLLNEGIRLHDFSTLTFGLTDGWWLFEDVEARLPHSPLLDEALWRKALAGAFDSVEVHGHGDAASQAVFIARAKTIVKSDVAQPTASDSAPIERVVCRQLATILGISPAEIDPDRRFSELGVDSILGVDLVQRINDSLHTDLPATVLFDYPSVALLAKHVAPQVPLPPSATAERPRPADVVQEARPTSAADPQPQPRSTPIAIVGLAGRFPGARNADEFWRDLRNGTCRIGEVPRTRWDVSKYYDPDATKAGKSPCKWGGFIDGIDEFDPAFFHMSGAEAEYTDPQQRLFVQEAWHALEDAGYSPSWLDGQRCGVFVGAGAGDYVYKMSSGEPQPQAFLGNGVSVLASRIAYVLNLRGPALAVDTACSSSLLAVHLACQSIRSGDCDLALAGGVFVTTMPSFHYLTGRLGMLSPTGLCRAFDDGADGFIPGEGVGAIVLRPLDAALRDGDFIYGVIAGSGANQDGHSNGITAPSALSQADLETDVYTRAGIDPRTISYVEAHGTGTRLGDPIEIEALTKAFGRFTADRGFCAIGSVKTNIGHAGPAAGIAGLIKVLLAMKHRQIPASLNFDAPNHAIDFARTPFFVNAERRSWKAAPMRAAISAFGLSGTNVHLVIEEGPAPVSPARRSARQAVYPVSAATEESLRERVAQLESWLSENPHDPQDVAYTLAVGRKHFQHRAVLNAPPDHPLAARYLAGEEIDWAAEYPPAEHRRVPLPGYPFSRERYWVPETQESAAPTAAVRTYTRTWVASPAENSTYPQPIALIGATEAERAALQSLTGARLTGSVEEAAVVVLLPRCYDSVEGYLDLARRITRGQRVVVAHRPAEHAAIATAGLHQSLRFVHPDVLWQTVETGTDVIADVARELRARSRAAAVRYRNGLREERTSAGVVLPQNTPPLERGSVWWITGGTGQIGTRVARWLVDHCDARVVVTARRAPVTHAGSNIEFMAADAADREAMSRVVEFIQQRYGRLDGVVHAAGFIDPPLLSEKSSSAAVLRPKIDGALILDELTRELSPGFFVLFSSLSAIAGDFGQCDYAAANRYLESFAEWRAARRPGRTVAIHWPLWAEGGMHLPDDREKQYLADAGLESLPTDAALRVFGQALAATQPVIAVACGDKARIDMMLGAPGTRRPEHRLPAGTPASMTNVSSGDGPQLRADLERIVLERTASIVRLPVSKLSADSRFSDVGLDSLYMKDLAAALSDELGISITPTAFFEHQSIGALAEHLRTAYGDAISTSVGAKEQGEIAGQTSHLSPPLAEQTTADARVTEPASEAIAIIGISGRFPQSRDVHEFWAHLAAGDDCITEIPPERWDWRAHQSVTGREHDKSVSRWGGFMPDIDRFDAAFFGISPREAVYMDPQHRLFLQTVWSALEDAGVRPSTLAGAKVGVWVGAQLNEYMGLMGEVGEARAQAALGNTQTMLANRVSYWFDFRGPSQTVDTACSSSLVAVHRAVQALRSGECELAIAGGVSAILSADTYVLASQLGMLSADGRCKTFDRSANGYVKGEGVGAVLLKPLSRALADGHHVYAVIRATAEGHGGKSSSLTAPNPQAQAQLVAEAWRRSGLPIDTASYIETHGTGTELGDPIEVQALSTAFRTVANEQGVDLQRNSCGLGAVKSNIGHLEPAAGIAGLIKVVLAMQHRVLPPTLHVKDVNAYLQLPESPFRLVTSRTPWAASPLRAGISAFGFGGSNAHIVLEEAPAQSAADTREFPAVVPLSAKTPDALREVVQSLADHLRGSKPAWPDVVHTLSEGRERFAHTIGFAASSVSDLETQLRAWRDGRAASVPVPETTSVTAGRRIPLPTYPFARTRIWFDRKPAAATEPRVSMPAESGREAAAAAHEPQPAPPAFIASPAEEIRSMLAELLYLEAAAIDDDSRFVDLGLDSILAVEFAKKLKDRFEIDLRATRLYDYSSVRELADAVAQKLLVVVPKQQQETATEVRLPQRAATATPDGTLPRRSSIDEGNPPSSKPGGPVKTPSSALHPLEEVRTMLADLLYVDASAISDDAPFVELGLDSILSVEFVKKLKDRFGFDVRASRLYDYSTVRDLANFVAESLASSPAASQPAQDAPEEVVSPAVEETPASPQHLLEPAVSRVESRDIAIIGMSGRFPGADNVREFWSMLANGTDATTDFPADRYDIAEYYDPDPAAPNKTYCRRGGFLRDVDKFDALFFNISPREAEQMDPQQRLFLEESWKALEDAGCADTTLSNTRCAVYVGVASGDYGQGFGSTLGPQLMLGNSSSILASRISYFLNLKGPSVALDTACSSSLVAIHLACQSILSGESDLALAGGVCVMTTPMVFVMTSQARMLAPDGRCKTFDERANGFVPAEGVGVVVLKSLSKAIADGDHIHAVIRGSRTNQDGKTNGITAPSALSQTALQLAVYENSGLDPATITCVEAHGTGTTLGDPIEVDALTDAFRRYTNQTGFCAIGAVKTNIGHALAAAGVASVIKTALALRHQQIPPSINYDRPNGHIDFAHSPFFVNTTLRPWEPIPGAPRRAAINSFGFSGTNAHVVLEEAPLIERRRQQRGPFLVTLSAKTAEALQTRIADLVEWLSLEGSRASMADISFTLAAGRSHFAQRVALVADDPADAARKLASLRESGNAPDCVVGDGSVRRALSSVLTKVLQDLESTTENSAARREALLVIAECYASGSHVDWRALFPAGTARRIPMPTYPFARTSHWFSEGKVARPRGEATLHPLLDRSVPSLDGATFVTELTKDHWVVRDHVVQGRPMLPGAAYLEIARAAGAALGKPVTTLRRVVWQTPFVLTDEPQQLTTRVWREDERISWQISSGHEGATVVHARGELDTHSLAAASDVDTGAVAARLTPGTDPQIIYSTFESLGVAFGNQFRRIRALSGSASEALGRIDADASTQADGHEYVLHPALLDAALQSMIGVHASGGHNLATDVPQLFVPFAVDEIAVHGPLTRATWSHVRRAAEVVPGSGIASFDISILDDAGRVLVTLTNFTVRQLADPSRAADAMSYLAPRWMPVPVAPRSASDDGGQILVVRPEDDHGITAALAEHFGTERIRPVTLGPGGLARVPELDACSAVWFLGGVPQSTTDDLETIGSAVNLGSRSLLRLVQAIDAIEPARRPRSLQIVTVDAQHIVENDTVRLWGTFMTGFAKATAAEYPDMRVSVADVTSREWRSSGTAARARIIDALQSLHAEGDAIEIGWRDGAAYVRSADLLELPPTQPERLPLKKGGVYLVVGGATGIGLTISEYLARAYGSRLLILGRSALDEKRKAALRVLEAAGAEVVYEQADVADLPSVSAAVHAARERWGGIDGVIHSAIVLRDRPIRRMDDAALDEVFAPKVTGSLVLGEVFRNDALDFFAVFSSAVALTGNAGQANYSAASTFLDAWALSLRATRQWPVSVINWGYWGEVGIVATREYESRMTRRGVESISQSEGVEAFCRILASGLPQLAVLKVSRTDPAVQRKFAAERVRTLRLEENSSASVIETVTLSLDAATAAPPAVLADPADMAASVEALETYAAATLVDAFHRMGVLESAGEQHTRQSLEATLGVVPKYARLFAALLDILRRHDVVEIDDERIRVTGRRPNATVRPAGAEAMLHLLDTCLGECEGLLAGRIAAADVLFPRSSMHLVEPLYKNNAVADYFNGLLAKATGAAVDALANGVGRDRSIRLLEVGAGTGSATAAILERLAPPSSRIEYHYTDVSRAFVEYGRRTFAEAYPFVTFAPLDIEHDIATQGFATGAFDIVIASNVLHATRDIERTLFQVKRLLRRGGVLLLNEVTAVQDATTLTFGFTDGWWLFEDSYRRQAYAPILSPQQWRAAFTETGFMNASAFGLQGRTEVAGQNIVVAESDGWIPIEKAAVEVSTPQTAKTHAGPQDKAPAESVASLVAEVLHISPVELDANERLESYGVDSIVSLEVLKRLEQVYGPQPKTLLFEYPTIEALSRHLEGGRAAASVGTATPADSLVAIDTRGSGTPSFWVHGLLGDAAWVTRLAYHLGPGRPVYAFQAPGLAGETAPVETIADLASLYLGSMRRVQPSGPYILGGYSLGGAIAFEIARQLISGGERVSHLFLLDSYAPGSRALDRLREIAGDDWAWLTVGNMLAQQWGADVMLEPGSIPDGEPKARARFIAGELIRRGKPPVSVANLTAMIENGVAVLNANGAAARHYAPPPLAANGIRPLLFHCDEGFVGAGNPLHLPPIAMPANEPDHGWGRLLPEPLTILNLPCDHFGLTNDPVVPIVAEAIRSALAPDGRAPMQSDAGHAVFEAGASTATSHDDGDERRAQRVFTIVRDHVQRILPDIPADRITLSASLRELGANSLDRVEVATCTMEDLQLSVAPSQLAGVQNIGGLVNVFLQHLRARDNGGAMQKGLA